MDTDDLDFLPMLTDNIKQELFEASEKSSNICDSVEEDKVITRRLPPFFSYSIEHLNHTKLSRNISPTIHKLRNLINSNNS